MYISLNWLRRYIDINAETLNNKLSIYTSEIESEKHIGALPNIIIGEIKIIEPHPNADKLRVAKVDTGEATLRQIVCGAPNIAVGQRVPVAMPGAIMPAGFEIKEATLRDVQSNGMICSSDELGIISERQPGILVLPTDAPIGKNVAEYLELSDTIFEIENKSITNRPDLFGHFGIAREISVFEDIHLKPYMNDLIQNNSALPKLDITIEDKTACFRYVGVQIDNITPKESPTWMKNLLTSVGINPHNSIVDITNFIMYDLGQPMHAFDSQKIDNGKIEIGFNKVKEEEVTTLKDENISILDGDLLIKNNGNPVAVAGIMGLKNSSISDETTSIILEAATFHYANIRKTSRRLGLRSESSLRFEKELDPELTIMAMHKAISLVMEIHPEAMIASQITDIYPNPREAIKIGTSYSYLEKRLGEPISKDRIQKILSKLGFVLDEAGDNLIVSVPSWRSTGDISIEEDIMEEIVRMYGFNDFKGTLPLFPMTSKGSHPYRDFQKHISKLLVHEHQLLEVDNYTFYSKKLHNDFLLTEDIHKDPVVVINPLSSENELMRTSIVPHTVLDTLANTKYNEPIGTFEIGKIYPKQQGKIYNEKEKSSFEKFMVGISLYTKNTPTDAQISQWSTHPFFHMKHIISDLLSRLHTDKAISFTKPEANALERYPWAHPGRSASIFVGDELVGMIGELHPEIAHNIGAEQGIITSAECDLELLFKAKQEPKFKEFSTLPALSRDMSFVMDTKLPTGDILSFIQNYNEYVTNVSLTDIYEGEHIGKNKKSITCSVEFSHPHKTLTDEAINKIAAELFIQANDQFGAVVRGA